MPGSTGWGCSDETSISTLGRGQGRGPSHFEVPSLGRDVRPDVDQRRRDAGDAEGHAPGHEDRRRPRGRHGALHHDADRLPAQRARRRHLRVGLRRRPDRQRRERPAHLRGARQVRGQAHGRRRRRRRRRSTSPRRSPARSTLSGPATASAGSTATFTAPADQDVTYEVFRGTTLIERKAGTSFSYSSPIAATDTIKACVNSGLACPADARLAHDRLAARGRLERAVGRDHARRLDLHRRGLDRPQLDDRARDRRRRDRGQPRRAHLQRPHVQGLPPAAEVPRGGHVQQRRRARPRPPGRDPRQRDGRHPHGRDRGARPCRVRAGQAGARVEHARRDRLRRQAHQPRQRRPGGLGDACPTQRARSASRTPATT